MATSRKPQIVDDDLSAWIESGPDVLAGEPVLRGTRIAARFIAELIANGAAPDEIVRELEITREQIDAALVFDRSNPPNDDPAARRLDRVPAP